MYIYAWISIIRETISVYQINGVYPDIKPKGGLGVKARVKAHILSPSIVRASSHKEETY